MLVFVVISCSIITRLFLCVVMQVLIIFVVKVTLLRMLRSDAGCICGSSAGLQLGRSLLRSDVVWSGSLSLVFYSPSSVSASTWYREIFGWQWQGFYLNPRRENRAFHFLRAQKFQRTSCVVALAFLDFPLFAFPRCIFFLVLPRHVC